jgi:hypothetical protein
MVLTLLVGYYSEKAWRWSGVYANVYFGPQRQCGGANGPGNTEPVILPEQNRLA